MLKNNINTDKNHPPLKRNPYFNSLPKMGVPINIKTRGEVDSYQQIGILTKNDTNNKNLILSLMGRRLYNNKWQYYSKTDQYNSNMLPVMVNGKKGTIEYGVDELFQDDIVYVDGYNDRFKVTIYENNGPRYIPFL